MQKVDSLEQSRSETPSSRSAGSTTSARTETDPSPTSTSRPKKRTSEVFGPPIDEESKPTVQVKKPRQLPNFTKIVRPPRSPEAAAGDCKPLVPSATASPLTPLPPLPDEPVGQGDYFPTPTLSLDEIGSNSSYSAALIPITEQNSTFVNPRYSPSRDPRNSKRTVEDRNTLGVTLGSPVVTPSTSPSSEVKAAYSPDHAKRSTPTESALTTPISVHPDCRLTDLPVVAPQSVQDITPSNSEPAQYVPLVPKYEPSRDPRLQRRLNSASAHQSTVSVDLLKKQGDEYAKDKSSVRVEESSSRMPASARIVSEAKPKQTLQPAMWIMPERCDNLSNVFKAKRYVSADCRTPLIVEYNFN